MGNGESYCPVHGRVVLAEKVQALRAENESLGVENCNLKIKIDSLDEIVDELRMGNEESAATEKLRADEIRHICYLTNEIDYVVDDLRQRCGGLTKLKKAPHAKEVEDNIGLRYSHLSEEQQTGFALRKIRLMCGFSAKTIDLAADIPLGTTLGIETCDSDCSGYLLNDLVRVCLDKGRTKLFAKGGGIRISHD